MLLQKKRFYNVLKTRFTHRVFRKLTRKSLNVLLKGGDIISQSPLIDGIWAETTVSS